MTTASIAKYKTDLEKLIEKGERLKKAILIQSMSAEDKTATEKRLGKEQLAEIAKNLPSFKDEYQIWYSEAQSLVKQLLPNRFSDFVSLYEKPKSRKDLNHGTYVIADYMQGLGRQNAFGETVVSTSSAVPQFEQQLNIVRSVQSRFESSLFDIKQLVQADLFDSELDASRSLLKNGFERAAGAIAGVVLERHLKQVVENHSVKLTKKVTTIAVLNDALKEAEVIDMPTWRLIQRLGDLRNICDHSRESAPTNEDVSDLIGGAEKITKTLF